MAGYPEDIVAKEELTALRHQHLLGLATYGADEIELILDTARQFRSVLERPIRRVPTLRGITVVNLFFESSTRTRISFELAERRLSAETINFSASGSSVSKGETLKDTARNIEAMKIDMVVIRHKSPGAPHFLTRCVDAVVINAGDGAHEHPTQALLDMLTISDNFESFAGLNVSIIGDISHSRVARSNLYALRALGANVTLCGPRTMMPVEIERPASRIGSMRRWKHATLRWRCASRWSGRKPGYFRVCGNTTSDTESRWSTWSDTPTCLSCIPVQ